MNGAASHASRSFASTSHVSASRVSTSRRLRWGLLVALAQLPVLMLVLRAVAPSWNFPDILPSAVPDMSSAPAGSSVLSSRLITSGITSLLLAFATGLTAATIGLIISRGMRRATLSVRRTASILMFFPVIAPPVALGVGLQVVLLRLGLGSTTVGVWLAHVIPAVGYVTLYLLGVLSNDDTTRDEAARTLGASAWQTWFRVTIPALRRRVAEAVVLGALVSWGQLALTLLVGGGVVRTMPVELLAIIRSGDDHLAAIASMLLTIPPLVALSVLKGGAERTGVPA